MKAINVLHWLVSVKSNLHLSETILRVVTAAVSPLRLFLYIFSPCWFLLSFVLMRLRMAHSTAWSDLVSTVREYFLLSPDSRGKEIDFTPSGRTRCRPRDNTWSIVCWFLAGPTSDSSHTELLLLLRTRHRDPSQQPHRRGPSPPPWCSWWPPDLAPHQGSPPPWRERPECDPPDWPSWRELEQQWDCQSASHGVSRLVTWRTGLGAPPAPATLRQQQQQQQELSTIVSFPENYHFLTTISLQKQNIPILTELISCS